MRFTEPSLARDESEWKGLVEMGVDVFAGFGDGGGFAAFLNDSERVGMFAELLGETLQQRDHALVAQWFHEAGLDISGAELIAGLLVESLATNGSEQFLELVFRWGVAEYLTGFEETNDRCSHFDGDGGCAEA